MTTLSKSRTGSAAAGASTKENPRLPYATGSAGLAKLVRGSSRRIMIMRFRPANISLINRRHYLPRLLLTLSSKRQIQKPHQRFEDVDRVTPYQVRVARQPEIEAFLVNRHLAVQCRRLIGPSMRGLSKERKGHSSTAARTL